MKKFARVLFFRLLLLCLFILVAGFAVTSSLGYKYSLKYGLFKTSIIDIRAPLGNISVFLDGELVLDELPGEIHDVPLGEHLLRFEKENYLSKQKKAYVQEGLVTRIDNVFLYPSKPLISTVDNTLNKEVIINNDGSKLLFGNRNDGYKIYPILVNDDVLPYINEILVDDNARNIDWISNSEIAWVFGDKFIIYDLTSMEKSVFEIPIQNIISWEYISSDNSFIFSDDKNSIYKINLKKNNENVIEKTFITLVDNYWIIDGFIYSMKDKVLYKWSLKGDLLDKWETNIWEDIAADVSLIEFNGLLVLWGGKGKDFYLIKKDSIELVLEDVMSVSSGDVNGNFIYLSKSGDIYLYNIFSKLKKFITRYASENCIIKRYRNNSYFWLFDKNKIRICDIKDTSCETFLDNLDGNFLSHYFPSDNIMVYSQKGALAIQALDDGEVITNYWWQWR